VESKSFTLQNSGFSRRIITDVSVFNFAFEQKQVVKALWDTGATMSVITENLAKTLNLEKVTIAQITSANGIDEMPVYMVNFKLPNDMNVAGIKVISCKSIHDFDAIIGMDIIAKGDFAITGKTGNTKFSFRMPSIADIDFSCH
jgi:hypothetical protein